MTAEVAPSFLAQRIHILDGLEYVKIQKVMQALNWSWASEPGVTPSVEKLRATADQCLCKVHELMKEKDHWFQVATGGFQATGECRDVGVIYTVVFVVTERNCRWASE